MKESAVHNVLKKTEYKIVNDSFKQIRQNLENHQSLCLLFSFIYKIRKKLKKCWSHKNTIDIFGIIIQNNNTVVADRFLFQGKSTKAAPVGVLWRLK